ncbi:MAG: hypothetical protein CSA66_06320 [Proteobacteria bacterium]|nr:MAG: hypothetical protein CSA66_06320 [Pseudomonadota bacterium]
MVHSLGITLDPESDAPLYRQIAEQLAARIRQGTLPAGFKLPPSRRLAGQLGAHRNTVVRAYEALGAGGLITSTVGRGTFVADRVDAPPQRTEALGELPWGTLLSRAAEGERLARLERLARTAVAGDVINLTRMQPSDDLLPHDLMRRCVDHVFRAEGPAALGYASRQGLPRLRELIVEDLARVGVPASADHLLVTTGSQQGIDLIARALVNPGDAFLTEGRTYSGALNVLAASGARVVGVACDEQGPEISALQAYARRRVKGLYLIPNSRNPTGTTISTARREAIISWSHRASVPLVEDDYGADLDLDGRPAPPALRALDPDVFYLGTFSKKLIPALRVGFVLSPAPLTQTLVSLKHAMDLGTSALLQHALAEFLARGYMRTHLKRLLPAYRDRRDALAEALRAHLPPEVSWAPPSRGVVQWLTLPAGVSAEEAFEEAKRQGVLVSPGSLYTTGARSREGLRLCLCAEPPARLADGARRLGRALDTLMRRRRAASAAPARATIDLF